MASDSETYNQQLSAIGGKDGPRYFHKGLMHALATIWIRSRPDMASNDCVRDLLTCPSTKINRKATHPLQNMNNPAARAIKRKLPMKKLVKRWNKIGMKKREKIKNKYVAETMKSFVKYLVKKVDKGFLVVNGLCDSAIEWHENADTYIECEAESHQHHSAHDDNVVGENASLSPWPEMDDSPHSQVSVTGDNDYAIANQMSVDSAPKVSHSPSADMRNKMKNEIIRNKVIREITEMKAHINSLLDEKIRGLNAMF